MTDELALRELFFGEGDGKNYAALCHSQPSDNTKRLPISSVFQDAKSEGSVKAEFVLVDCTYVLPSGKSIADRFGLDLTRRPSIFVSGKIGSPKQIPEKHLKTGKMLVKALKSKLEPHVAKVENTKQLKECLGQNMCVVFLKAGPPEKYVRNTFQNLIAEFQGLQFAVLDSSNLILTNLEQTNIRESEFTKGEHRLVVFKKISGSLTASNASKFDEGEESKHNPGRLVTSVVAYTGTSFHHSSLSSFLADIVNGKYLFTKLPALPAIKTRSKKNEEAEGTKRKRYLDRKVRETQRQHESSSQSQQRTSDGIFTKEQRKADRDRLRDDHRKVNKVRDLTPEEIAERERNRRQRMEEEAAKWNVLPDDAPPEDAFNEEHEEENGEMDLDEVSDEDVVDLDG